MRKFSLNMTQEELIAKIKDLKAVEPSNDWVLSTKTRILGTETRAELFPFFKPVYAGLFCLLFLIGLFEVSQDSLPGESLYYLKKITEKSQVFLSSEAEKPSLSLAQANKRLEELDTIARKNEVQKLAPAIDEFQSKVSEAAKSLSRVNKVDEQIVAQARKLDENKEKVEKSLATKIETDDYYNALAAVVQREIADLESKDLTEQEKAGLEQAKQYLEQEDYTEALITILEISQN